MGPRAESGARARPRAPELRICDVTLRDGMQTLNRDQRIPVAARLELYRLLERAGLPYVEVGSFVHPRVIPAMADTAELLDLLPEPATEIAVLIPKLAYYRMSPAAHRKVGTVALFVSASERYSRANTKMSKAEALAAAGEVAAAALADGHRLRGYLSCAFRDLGDGAPPIDPEVVRADCHRLVDLGCSLVSVSDTEGRATPRDVETVLSRLGADPGFDHIGVHFHDRFGQGIANAFAAYKVGVRSFDGSIGGIGGTRTLRDTVGNVATEELVALFNGLGLDTGVDLETLRQAGRLVVEMSRWVGDPPPPSKLLTWQSMAEPEAAAAPADEEASEVRRGLAALMSTAARSRLGAAAIASVLTMLLVLLTGLLLTHVFSVFSIVRGQARVPGRAEHVAACLLTEMPWVKAPSARWWSTPN